MATLGAGTCRRRGRSGTAGLGPVFPALKEGRAGPEDGSTTEGKEGTENSPELRSPAGAERAALLPPQLREGSLEGGGSATLGTEPACPQQ